MNLQINGLKVDGGEGSKGGKIIGHTGSGKPIYMSPGHKAHSSFTSKEHHEASKLHSKLHKSTDEGNQKLHDHGMTAHANTARELN